MAAVTLALVGFFAFLILRVTAPQMTPLFTDLSYEDSSATALSPSVPVPAPSASN